MKTRSRLYTSVLTALLLLTAGCAESEEPAKEPASNVVEFTLEGLTISGPDQLPSGWTTIRVHNNAPMTHFVLFDKMPEGRDIEDHAVLARVFQEGMDLLNEGRNDEAFAAFGQLPEWFADVVFSGGPGFLGPGESLEISLFIEPGTYVAECYVKTNGVFHSYNPNEGQYGMVHQFTVTDANTGAQPPEPTEELTISSENGIEGAGHLSPGRHVVAVHFGDQIAHENFLGHDVHLVRLTEASEPAVLQNWMNYLNPDGLETPAPATFLGGTNEMPAGATAYLTFTLVPGRYAWIAEVPDPAGKGMYVEFAVE